MWTTRKFLCFPFYGCLDRVRVIAAANFRVQLFNSADTSSGFWFGNTLFKSQLSGPYACMETLSKETWKSLLAKSPFGCLSETPWGQYFSFPKLHGNPKRFAMTSSRDTQVQVTGESICAFSQRIAPFLTALLAKLAKSLWLGCEHPSDCAL